MSLLPMAISSTIFKVLLNLSDLNRNHFKDYKLTIARHPSENDQRMMLRLIAFSLFANDQLSFTKGISSTEEPDLWIKNYAGEIECWIELGQPDERRIRQAFSLAQKVIIISYGDKSFANWQSQLTTSFKRFPQLKVLHIHDQDLTELTKLVDKNMQLHCSIQENEIYIGNDSHNIQIAVNQIG